MRFGHATISNNVLVRCRRCVNTSTKSINPSRLTHDICNKADRITYAPDDFARLTLKDVLRMEQRGQVVDVQS